MVFVGRRDGQISLHGHRIEPAEVETAARECLQVDDAALVLVLVLGNEENTVLLYVGTAQNRPAPVAVRRELTRRLPGYMVPRTIRFLDRLPTNAAGKLDRSVLARLTG